MNKKSRIYLAGHSGLVGSAILKNLKKRGFLNLYYKTSKELNLIDTKKTYNFLKSIKPEYIIIAAAKVGGINANQKWPVEFLSQNLSIQNNIINSAYKCGVKNLLFLGSSCVYPVTTNEKIKENYILNSKLEKTNEAYAIAKIAGIKLCEYYKKQYNVNYFTLMPCNVFGPNDNYNLKTSHFLPAIIKKVHEAKIKKKKSIKLWGTGKPLREVIFSDDLADACIYMLQTKHKENIINIGTNIELSVKEYAEITMDVLDYKTKILFDKTKPDGVLRKKLNTKLADKLGWKSPTDLKDAIKKTYESFVKK